MAGRKIRANGREYTPEEFICEWCSTPLVLDTYYTIDGKNVCQSCRNKERCASCGFLITESKYVTLDDKTYHPDCFRCCECLVELPGKFHFEDNQLYCGECILLKGGDNIEDMCAKCYMPLSGGIIKALGNRYHENCFVCHSCFGDFPNDEFVNVKGNPYCDKCIDDNSYLRSTAHLKATGQDPNASSSTRSAGGAGGYGAGNTGSGAGAGYGSGAGNTGAGGYGAGNTGAGGYGAGNTGAGYGSGAGNTGAGGYGAGNTGSGAGGYGAGGPGGYGNNSTSRSGPEVVHKSAPPAEEYETVVENSFLNPAGLPPKGASKYDVKQKPKYGGGMKEEKRTRDYKSKAALGFSSETEHLKDMESLGYKTIRRK